MTEHEWEKPRIPRANASYSIGPPRRRLGPIDHYIALECPRESVAWVTKSHPPSSEGFPKARAGPKKQRGEASDHP
jgi:hypothetical protein